MLKKVIVMVVLQLGVAYSQVWLDPANFPSATSCDTSWLILPFEGHYRGDIKYKIRTTPPVPSSNPRRYYAPVIDGLLEDSIWWYAETLLINSWEDAGAALACLDPREFKGPEDLHAIWRFCYNHDGLYVGIEMHDDIHDVDSLQGWYLQDGIQLSIDPWDWGDYNAGLWSRSQNYFRRYYSNGGTVMTKSDNSHTAFLMLLKRMNEEPYFTGLIHATYRSNFSRGDEATNFTSGQNAFGIAVAAKSQGTDPWFRSVWHMEFKFPYKTALWSALDGTGFYGSDGLPQVGNVFKMDFFINDDDILGSNGSKGGVNQMYRHRRVPFNEEASGHDHWSDTKYYMAMQYDGNMMKQVVHPYTSSARHGDKRITGIWVDAATQLVRYAFTGDGTVVLSSTPFYFDSTSTNGGVITNSGGTSFGSYQYLASPGGVKLNDTLKVTYSSTNLTLVRELITGYSQVEGRWVQAHLVATANARCGGYDTAWVPNTDAKEFRFCPLSKLRLDSITYPQYKRCRDSLRIYNFANDSLLESYTYTSEKAVLGRTYNYFSYEIKKVFHDTMLSAPRNLILTYLAGPRTGQKDTLVEWKTFNMSTFGEVGTYNVNQVFMMYSSLPQGMRQVWRFRVMDKYTNSIRIYPDSMTKTVSYQANAYPDRILNLDTLAVNYWSSVYPVSFSIDSVQLMGYDSVSRTATGTLAKASYDVFPDRAWVLQTCKIRMQYSATVFDSFIFKDTTHTFWALGPGESLPVPFPINGIYPGCPTTEAESGMPVKEVTVANYPNPFNPSTVIRFAIPGQRSEVRYSLSLFNIRGQLVRTLVKGRVGSAGLTKKVVWEGTDNAGRVAGTGVYFYRLIVGAQVLKGTMVLVK